MKNKGVLIIFSGLPGSGKTTLASKLASDLAATYLRVDTVEASLRDGSEVAELGVKCYRVAQTIARENLVLGNLVIGDCVNPVSLSRAGWNEVAKSAGKKFINIEVVCSNKDEHRKRLENRTTTIPGLVEPTWEQVQKRDYHSWDQERIVLETSGKSVDASFIELRLCLKDKLGL